MLKFDKKIMSKILNNNSNPEKYKIRDKKDFAKIRHQMKKDGLHFDKEKFIQDAKDELLYIYEQLRKNNISNITKNYNLKFANNILKNKDDYRISNDIDTITVQYIDLFDYESDEKNQYIKVYVSLYFYDNASNNSISFLQKNRYWNDIWIITYEKYKNDFSEYNNECKSCGGNMIFDEHKKILTCPYCGETRYVSTKIDGWNLIDIEVQKNSDKH